MEETAVKQKFCKHCGEKIDYEVIICPKCGKQVEEFKQATAAPQVVINNTNTNTNTNANVGVVPGLRPKNKWVSLLLCFFLGFFGAHKFYENKAGMGVLYILTAGLFGIGCLVDFITLLFKPNPYYVM
ncbi:MAG: TM2 domain-containing protein [Oscillospiraceae bacterium]|jgi:RNA polymerase subunit RPABC4/transcription elongation factor Spt4|nr:TM2 domain-containing protein [Oscillospiraceae bacterium]